MIRLYLQSFNKDNPRYRREFRRWRLRMKITSLRYWWTALVAVVILGIAHSILTPNGEITDADGWSVMEDGR